MPWRYFENHFLCEACPLEWTDEMVVVGASFCPCCDAETEPYASVELLDELTEA